MKVCQNCKSQMDDNYIQCPTCLSTNIEYINTITDNTVATNNVENNVNTNTKRCKYCNSEIDKYAKVCPNCRKGLTILNKQISPLWYILVVIPIVIGLYCYLSPNAPLEARDFFCSTGLRKDRRYCSYSIWETYR